LRFPAHSDIGLRLSFIEAYVKLTSFNVLIVAYQGYSHSDGKDPSESKLQQDGLAILEYAFSIEGIDKSKILIHGRSLGGAVTVYALTKRDKTRFPVRGAILENTFTSIPDVVRFILPKPSKLGLTMLLRNHWPSIKRIKDISCPVLFISGRKDEIIPPSQMDRLYKEAKEFKMMVKPFVCRLTIGK
jgi:fermentation-respiration switch protein FrsA (DUF1100 family)